jgi:hypothetical protein
MDRIDMNIDAKTALSLVDAYCDGLIKNSGIISDTPVRKGWNSAVEAIKGHLDFIRRVHLDDDEEEEDTDAVAI